MRLALGIPFAALVTAALFVVMYGLVRPGEVTVLPSKAAPDISIFAKIDDSPLDVPETKIDRQIDAPPPPVFTPAGPVRGDGPILRAPDPERFTGSETTFGGTPVVMALATLAPQYPGRCLARGTEGFAVVRYDVAASGQVTNAEVIRSSHRCFEDAALQAIRGWRYQPNLGADGYVARGLTYRFAFELEET